MPISDPGDYAIAFNFRQLVLWFGAQLMVGLASLLFDMVGSTMTVMATIVILAALAYYAYRTAEALGVDSCGAVGCRDACSLRQCHHARASEFEGNG
jgi:hypothetical protein